ncbi:cytochrome C oxidase subunit II [Synechococcales cyanobacterium C]|uniref:Cytochrome c oxidase subunit 2 n=1 Tax=Petrachloros mirabilis ULC683 TaxID=2781853 RepID=A0A8K1ZYV0_9CYAN|nr:cytochrome C oxidase subunit II [Petrachloros mirabilis ULC683]
MKIPSTITTLIAGIALTLISLWYGQNNGLLPTVASVEADSIDQLFNTMMAIATGLFLLVQGALVYSLFAFRRRKDDDNSDAEPIEGNVLLELVWTAVPTVIVMWLSIYSFDVYKSVNSGGYIGPNHMAHAHPEQTVAAQPGAAIAAPLGNNLHTHLGSNTVADLPDFLQYEDPNDVVPSEPPLAVNVNGLQYAWIFTYPDSGIVSGEMHLPVNRAVELNISATDVIHAFWVPEFRLKQDAIPGSETHLSFTANRVGNYPVICAELCGAYHGAMKTRVLVQTPEDFQAWIDSQTVAAQDTQTTLAARTGAKPDQFLHPHLDSMGLPTTLDASAQTLPQMHPHHSHDLAMAP